MRKMYNHYVCNLVLKEMVNMSKAIKVFICVLCTVTVLGCSGFPYAAEFGEDAVCRYKAGCAEKVRYDAHNLLRTSTPISECEIIPAPVTEHTEQNGYLLMAADGYISDISKAVKSVGVTVNSKPHGSMKKCFYLII